MNRQLLHFCALLLCIVTVLSGIVLLLVSGWFIAACAVAGLTVTAHGFNYLVPAAVIRLLAIVRIASGYGEKAIGHGSLLQRLHDLRVQLFAQVMAGGRSRLRAEQLQQLNDGSQAMAERWLTVIHPNIANVVVIAVLTLVIALWLPYSMPIWLAVLLLNGALLTLLFYRYRQAIHNIQAVLICWRSALEHHLNSASLWSLSRSGKFIPQPLAQSWLVTLLRLRVLAGAGEALLILVSGCGILLLLMFVPPELMGAPLLMLGLVLFLAMPDWLGASLRSIPSQVTSSLSQRALSGIANSDRPDANSTVSPQLDEQFEIANKAQGIGLELIQFLWCQPDRVGQPLTACFNRGELVWIKGSSGCGKSALLQAMAGLLPSQGEIKFGPPSPTIPLAHLSIKQRRSALHYVEQFPYVLSATIEANLQLAADELSSERIQQALDFACLSWQRNEWQQWVGECGRNLSGGEIKRLGIARAWLKQPPIWLIDEPFAGLDGDTCQRLAENLNALRGQVLIIIASHLIPNNLCVDNVVALEEG